MKVEMQQPTKTPIAILQEFATKINVVPNFELIHSEGPPHNMIFTYRVSVLNVSAEATAKTKKDARQEVAKICLQKLTELNLYNGECGPTFNSKPCGVDSTEINSNMSYAKLKDFCTEFSLGEPKHTTISDTGPPHARMFEICVSVGSIERVAAASTKKAAKQIAAQRLLTFLKENMQNVLKEFSENQIDLIERDCRATERIKELNKDMPWRPILDEEKITCAVSKLELDDRDPVEQLEKTLNTMELQYEWSELSTWDNDKIHVLEVPRASPALAFCGTSQRDTAVTALDALKRLLACKVQSSPNLYSDDSLIEQN